jgi:beta-N-acetylglucosaminidase
MVELSLRPDTDLRLPTLLTSAHLNRTVDGTPLAWLGEAWKYAEYRYGVNALFLASVAVLESGWGRSALARNKNNIYGFMAFDRSPYRSAMTFRSKTHCILYVAKYISREYLRPQGRWWAGSPTLRAIASHWATDRKWAQKVIAVSRDFTRGL